MTRWSLEADRWRKAHDDALKQLVINRDLIDVLRAFIRKNKLENEVLEFILAARLGEDEAARLLNKIKTETQRTAA